jgi:hypothetical protein
LRPFDRGPFARGETFALLAHRAAKGSPRAVHRLIAGPPNRLIRPEFCAPPVGADRQAERFASLATVKAGRGAADVENRETRSGAARALDERTKAWRQTPSDWYKGRRVAVARGPKLRRAP